MKKITYFLIPLILLSFNSHANAIASGSEGIIERQGMKEAGKTVAKIMVAKSIWKHKKLIIGGALVVGVGGFISKEKFIDMIEHPEDHEDFMLELINDHPIKYAAFKKFLDLNIEKTNDMDYKQSLLDFEDYYHIGKEDTIYKKIIESPEYKNYFSIVKAKAKLIKDKYSSDKNKRICNIEYYDEIAHSEIDFPQNLLLSKGNTNDIYSVNRYGNFNNKKGVGMTPDHIPSYKSIEKFLINKGVPNISNKRKNNILLVDNTSAININTIEHQKGSKTFGGRNNSEVSEADSKDLLTASIEDISVFAAYLILEKNKNPIDYLDASYTLLERNYYLCLYEKEE